MCSATTSKCIDKDLVTGGQLDTWQEMQYTPPVPSVIPDKISIYFKCIYMKVYEYYVSNLKIIFIWQNMAIGSISGYF